MFPERFFDVGIAEEHAVTFAAGLAAGGQKPVFAVYSSFLQRAYDQVLHDVCLQDLPVVFAIDRAGIVGSDGETHQGIFDISYLMTIPNMTLMAPKNKWEFSDMIKFAVDFEHPIAVRYPRGEAFDGLEDFRAPIVPGRAEVLYEEGQAVLLAYGSMVKTALEVRSCLQSCGIECAVVNMRFAKPLDRKLLEQAAQNYELLVTMEENVLSGGMGEAVLETLHQIGAQTAVMHVAVQNEFIPHGNADLLMRRIGLDAESIAERIKKKLGQTDEQDKVEDERKT